MLVCLSRKAAVNIRTENKVLIILEKYMYRIKFDNSVPEIESYLWPSLVRKYA